VQTCALGFVHHLYLQTDEKKGGLSKDLSEGLPC